jgi:ribonuclease H / adenosylcobalamin/alpha-ribazole phosphatase
MRPDPYPHAAVGFGALGVVMAKQPANERSAPDLFDRTEEFVGGKTERHLIIEADGGARGNPGPAAYGAVVRDGQTSKVLAAEGLPIGRATNNVAEYRGLIAGLEMARELDPTAALEVRMDSKLVIEQMAGRWKIKHADMKVLALEAARLRPAAVTWTWVPRELNKAADALVNRALDGDPVPRQYTVDRPS